MIQIPPKVILNSLDKWCFLHFKDIDFKKDAPPHRYLTIPVNPGKRFVLCIATSKVEERLYYYQRINQKAAQSVVRLEPHTFSFLPKETLVDCNSAELLSTEELQKKIHPSQGLDRKSPEISQELKSKIIAAIKNSPVVQRNVKKALERSLE